MSSFGRLFRVTTFGESHGIGVGCIIDGVPPLLKIKESDIQYQLDRRKPNQNSLLSPRSEPDIVEIYSGVQDGVTLGTPVCLVIKNVDMKPGDYKSFSNTPRPGHADLTYLAKYGVKSSSGGGRASARETVARVAAGAIAEKYLMDKYNVEIVSWVTSVGDIEIPKDFIKEMYTNPMSKSDIDTIGTFELYKFEERELLYSSIAKRCFDLNDQCNEIFNYEPNSDYLEHNSCLYIFVEKINIRCPHIETAVRMISRIKEIKAQNDSIGGIVSCIIKNCPQCLGEPCFDKFEADLAKAMLSLPATKGFEIGSGFEGTKMT
jgi:chorismate synthase